MKNVSLAFQNELNNDNRIFINSCDITLADGTVLPIDNSNIWENGFKINNASSGTNSFDLGSVIIGKFTVYLNNIYDEYSAYDFTDCVASNVQVGLRFPDGTVETVSYGKYYLSEPKYNGAIITLEFYDCLCKFDKDYSLSKLEYPATLLQIVMDACEVCDVQLGTTSFSHDDYVVQTRPEDSALTFRQVLQWVGEISCNFCKSDSQGRLCLQWYDTDLLETLCGIDGGSFTSWNTGEAVDGGTLSPWTTGDTFDGGNLAGITSEYHHIRSFSSLTMSTDDVVITGVRVVQDYNAENGGGTVFYQSGTDGYVLSVEENKFIQGDMGNTVASMLGEKLIGLRFRPFDASCLSDPTIEAGDIAVITDSKGNSYNTIITSNVFQPGSYQKISCGAQTPARNSAARYSKATQAYIDYRKEIQKERTEREKALDALGERIDNSSGLFTTTETKEDGSKIHYMHNKPSLSESDIVWKMTSEAIGVSTDGGKTWNAGITVDGDAIVRILNAEGVNADWIRTGALVVKDADGNIIFSADMNTGKVIIFGDSVRIGDKTATKALEDLEKKTEQVTALSIILDNDYQGIPADYMGNIAVFPNVKTTAIVLYGHTDVSGDCSYTVTKSDGITGSWNNSTRTYTVVGISTDTGWVDITAVYLSVFTVTKRFTVSKVKGGVPGQDGADGKDGVPGKDGTDGKTSYFHIKYSSVANPTASSQMTETPSTYIGTYVDYTAADSSDPSKYTWSRFQGIQGETGEQGIPGTNGSNGKTSYLHIKYSNDGGKTFTANNGETAGDYIGQYVDFIQADSTSVSDYKWSKVKGDKGDTGATGAAGRTYFMEPSTLVIKRSQDNTMAPSNITLSAHYRDGTTTARTPYAGRFKIEESTDGSTYTTKYTSSSNESSKVYTPSSSSVKVIRCTLYAAGGTSQVLDIQSIAVVVDMDALTHEEIFNLLTNNGVVKGIYKEGDQLYISFTYAKGGMLTLGGANGEYGELNIYSSNKKQIIGMGRDGFVNWTEGWTENSGGRCWINDGKIRLDYSLTDIFTRVLLWGGQIELTDVNTGERYFYVNANGMKVSGTKSRIATTKNYSNRLLYCYEMPSPMFGDIGEAETDETGECYIYLDDIFSETVSAQIEYQVFLQKEGQGDIWVDSKEPAFFVVKGTSNLKFAWEIKAKQKEYEYERLESFEHEEESQEIDYEAEYMREINQLITEQESVLYGTDAV